MNTLTQKAALDLLEDNSFVSQQVKELIKDGTNGFLANNNEEWINKLSLLIESSKLRNNMGARGFDLVNQNYTIESCSNQFINIVEKQLSFRSSK